jgi:hypothetical protein
MSDQSSTQKHGSGDGAYLDLPLFDGNPNLPLRVFKTTVGLQAKLTMMQKAVETRNAERLTDEREFPGGNRDRYLTCECC